MSLIFLLNMLRFVPLKDKKRVTIVNAFKSSKQFKKKTKQNIG